MHIHTCACMCVCRVCDRVRAWHSVCANVNKPHNLYFAHNLFMWVEENEMKSPWKNSQKRTFTAMTFFAYEEEKWGKVLPTYERILNSLPQTPSIESPPQSTMWPHWLFNGWMCEWVGGCVSVYDTRKNQESSGDSRTIQGMFTKSLLIIKVRW